MEQWIIGGASRCGKSTISRYLCNNGVLAGFCEDTLLHKIISHPDLTDSIKMKEFVEYYLNKDRLEDPIRKTYTCPASSLSKEEYSEFLSAVANSDSVKPLNLWLCGMKSLAVLNGQAGFFLMDIHIEFHLEYIANQFENVRYLHMVRNPLSVICSSLYWRSYPKRCHFWRRELIYRTIMWCVSQEVATALQKQGHFKVVKVDLSNTAQLVKNDWNGAIANAVSRMNRSKLYYDYNSETEMNYTPDGDYKHLLNNTEIKFISSVTSPWAGIHVQNTLVSKVIQMIVRWIARNPVRRHGICRCIFFPIKTLRVFIFR